MTADTSRSQTPLRQFFLHHRPWQPVDWLLGVALVALTWIIVTWLIREPAFSDDLTYFDFAQQLLEGSRPRPNIANVYRFGFILQVSAAQFLLGYTDSAYYLISIGYSLGLVAVFFVLNRLLFGRVVAAGACLLLITNPIFLTEATLLHIDLPALSWFIAGMIMLFKGAQHQGGRANRWDRRSITYLLIAGACFFMSYWIKEGILILFPALPVVTFLFAKSPDRLASAFRLLIVMAVSFVAGLFVEIAVSHWLYGDPFIRLSMLMGGHVASSREAWVASGLVAPDLSWIDLALRYPRSLMGSTYGMALAVLSGVSLLSVGLVRNRRLIAIALLGLIGLMALSLLVSSLNPLVPFLRTKDRYLLTPLVPLFSVVTGVIYAGGSMLLRRWPKRPVWEGLVSGLAVTLVVLGLSIASIAEEQDRPYFAKNGARGLSETGALVKSLASQPEGDDFRIFSDLRTRRGLRMYIPVQYRWNLKTLDTAWQGSSFDVRTTDEFLAGDVVVLNRRRLDLNARNYYEEELPDWVLGPPAHWIEAVWAPSQRIASYYVAEVDELGAPGELLSEFHAYQYSADSRGLLSDKGVVDDAYEVNIQEADDVRLVSGSGRYHLTPEDPAYPLVLDAPGVLSADLSIEMAGDVTIRAVTAWLIGEQAETKSLEFERRVIDEDQYQYVLRIPVDPKERYEYLRIMVQVSGSGSVRIIDGRVGRLATDTIPSVMDPLW